MRTSEQINEIAKALNAMQSVMENATKKTEAFKYKYSDLSEVWSVLRQPMTDNGLCVIQDPISSEEGVSVTTRMMHTSGQWIEFGPLLVPVGKKDAHSTGSAITYAKRYALSAAFGVVTEDDDGEAAQKDAPKMQNKNVIPKVDDMPQKVDDMSPINDEQYNNLEDLLDQFDSTVLRSNVIRFLDKTWGITNLCDMPSKLYNSVIDRANKEINYQIDRANKYIDDERVG